MTRSITATYYKKDASKSGHHTLFRADWLEFHYRLRTEGQNTTPYLAPRQ